MWKALNETKVFVENPAEEIKDSNCPRRRKLLVFMLRPDIPSIDDRPSRILKILRNITFRAVQQNVRIKCSDISFYNFLSLGRTKHFVPTSRSSVEDRNE